MPIKGLTTERESSFPRIGVIRKGGEMTKTADGRTKPGQDLKWFRFDTDDADAARDFVAAYSNEPATINVYLPYVTPDENFQAWKEEYVAGGLVHRCDGETMSVHLMPDGKYSTIAKPCPYHAGAAQRTPKSPGCKPVGRLMVIIPELRRFAYVTVLTTSVNDIMELTDNLNAIYAMRGTLQGVPLILCRRPRMISTPAPDGKRVRYEKWMLSVEVNPTWAQMQLETMRKAAYLLPESARMLTDGRMVDESTGEIMDDDTDEPAPQPQAQQQPTPQRQPVQAAATQRPSTPQPPPVTEVTEPVDNPFEDDGAGHEAIAKGEPVLDAQLKSLHKYGTKLYGDGWDEKRRRLVETVTKGAATSSKMLSRNEADQLIEGMKKKLAAIAPSAATSVDWATVPERILPEELRNVPEMAH